MFAGHDFDLVELTNYFSPLIEARRRLFCSCPIAQCFIMSNLSKEMASMQTPDPKEVAKIPEVGSKAPFSNQLPLSDGRPTLLVFLRHCGCPCELNDTAPFHKLWLTWTLT